EQYEVGAVLPSLVTIEEELVVGSPALHAGVQDLEAQPRRSAGVQPLLDELRERLRRVHLHRDRERVPEDENAVRAGARVGCLALAESVAVDAAVRAPLGHAVHAALPPAVRAGPVAPAVEPVPHIEAAERLTAEEALLQARGALGG